SYSLPFSLSFYLSPALPDLHSFPTRRSSDLPKLTSMLSWRRRAGSDMTSHFAKWSSWLSVIPTISPCGLISSQPLVVNRSRTRRSEEHTSELQSRVDLVCRLLLEKKKEKKKR